MVLRVRCAKWVYLLSGFFCSTLKIENGNQVGAERTAAVPTAVAVAAAAASSAWQREHHHGNVAP
jgi:hypothetical protein